MKKDIYIIKNKINNKVYIGQTVNPQQRWAQYLSLVRKKPDTQVITKAMKRYGVENFSLEILESNIENFDEREKYWIQYYNSIVPNGYNVAPGGKGSGNGVLSRSASIKDPKILAELIDEIIQDEKTLKELAKKYNISYGVINEINQGHTYYNKNLYYPLRKTKKYDEEFIKQITYSLKYELDKKLAQIAQEYNIDYSFLNDINQGRAYYREYLQYPIRLGKMKKAEIIGPEIQNLLLNSTISQAQIARNYNVSFNWISNINLGRVLYDPTLKYPLRESNLNPKNFLSPDQVKEIYTLLKNTNQSMAKIAKQFNVTTSVIGGINNGKTKKYHIFNDKEYPIRKK